jgi:hypothetical protein
LDLAVRNSSCSRLIVAWWSRFMVSTSTSLRRSTSSIASSLARSARRVAVRAGQRGARVLEFADLVIDGLQFEQEQELVFHVYLARRKLGCHSVVGPPGLEPGTHRL